MSDIVDGRVGISPEMAIRLDKAFGGGARAWVQLQAAYNLAQAMKKARDIKVERLAPAARVFRSPGGSALPSVLWLLFYKYTMSLFEAWAEEQRVTCPFEALRRMDSAARKQIAEMLGADLSDPWENGAVHALYDLGVEADDQELPLDLYPWEANTQAETCLIIGADEYGIQARSDGTLRTLNPLADNHTWGEVLVSVIRDLKIPCQVDGKSKGEFESVIFEYVAEQEWKSKDERERREIQKFIN